MKKILINHSLSTIIIKGCSIDRLFVQINRIFNIFKSIPSEKLIPTFTCTLSLNVRNLNNTSTFSLHLFYSSAQNLPDLAVQTSQHPPQINQATLTRPTQPTTAATPQNGRLHRACRASPAQIPPPDNHLLRHCLLPALPAPLLH